MKKKNFIFIITYVTVCYGELIVEQGSNHETSSLNHSQEKTNSILQDIDGIFHHIPGLKNELWDLIKSLDACELRCYGKFCSCCQKENLVFFKLSVCFNSYLIPKTNSALLSMSAGNHELFHYSVKLPNISRACTKVYVKNFASNVCVQWKIKDYGKNGFTLCAYTDFIVKGTTVLQINFDCFNFDGKITLTGRTDVEEETIAFLRVLNPLKLAELLKKILLG